MKNSHTNFHLLIEFHEFPIDLRFV